MKRYARNHQTISIEQQEVIFNTSVLVIGLGGLGSVVVEGLARLGFLNIGICDNDCFDASNLNRQLLATEHTLYMSKVETARHRINEVNSDVKVHCYTCAFPNQKVCDDLHKYDLVLDCLDNAKDRQELARYCSQANKVLIHGAIVGDYGYLAVITLQNPLIDQLNCDDVSSKLYGSPFYTVVCIASLQLNLALKVVLEQEYIRKGFYHVDLKNMIIESIIIE